MRIQIIPCLQDNYSYLLIDEESSIACVIDPSEADPIIKYLEKHKIQTRPIFSGNILRHPAFSNLISKRNKLQSFKNSDYIMKYGLLIGCHQGLGVNDISYIHKKILAFIN